MSTKEERIDSGNDSALTESAAGDEAERGRDGLLLDEHSDEEPTLSVVIPTLNEEEGIRECIERIRAAVTELGIPAEVVISDSSTDRTPEIARKMGAIVVEPDQPGYGYAYRYAFDRARGEYIAIGDADTTYDFKELPKLLEKLIESDADMVMGSRFDGEIKDDAMPALHQYVGNPALTKFLNVFYGTEVSDAHSGFRVFRSDMLDELDVETDGMEFASEMIMEAGTKGLQIKEVPITYHEREGEATLHSFRDGWRHVRFMLLNAPGYLFSIPGFLMGGVGVALMALSLFRFGLELSVTGSQSLRLGTRSMIVGSLLTIIGHQAVSKGVFATIASNPIRKPEDPVTNWIVDHLSLEMGATIGLGVLLFGVSYGMYLVVQWLTGGYTTLPLLTHDIMTLTAIVLGVQTIFTSFFMGALGDK